MHDHYDYTPPIDWVGWLLLLCVAVFIYLAFTGRSPAAYLRIPPPLSATSPAAPVKSFDSGASYDAEPPPPVIVKRKGTIIKRFYICGFDKGCKLK